MSDVQDTVIRAETLGKAYRVGANVERADTFVGALASQLAAPMRRFKNLRRLNTFTDDESTSSDVIWALRDVSFEVKQGEVLGFVGRNGAGKSTLLKVLSRITQPTVGRAVMEGRVSSLLEVGTGFHPELTGHENIYMKGLIHGMTKREVDARFDAIVAFSGVERFLYTPVKRYSSGMKVRLGFAVAAHLEPEILIIDEVLAVGDAEFQKRCLGKMQNVAGSGRTILFVSHNMGAIQNLCSRVIYLRDGRVVDDGEPSDVIAKYLASFATPEGGGFRPDNPEREIRGSITFAAGRLFNSRGEESVRFDAAEGVRLELDYENPERVPTFDVRAVIRDSDGVAVYAMQRSYSGVPFEAAGAGTLVLTIPRLGLPIGDYVVSVKIMMPGDHSESDMIPNALNFAVETSTFFPTGRTPPRRLGRVLIEHRWESYARPEAAAAAASEGERNSLVA